MKILFNKTVFFTLIAVIFCGFVVTMVLFGLMFPKNKQTLQSIEGHKVTVLQSNIYYRVFEQQGPPIIFLHSFGDNLEMWNSLVKHLTYGRLITLDLPGFGASERNGTNFNLAAQHRHLLAFMDALGLEKVVLVGSSMGASIAAWTAAHSPERVDGLVLFAPSGYPDSMRHAWPGSLFYRSGMPNWFASQLVNTWFFRTMFPDSLALQALEVTASYDASFVAALDRIRQPTLIFWSVGDKRVPFSYSKVYRSSIPQARLVAAPEEAGHKVAGYEPWNTAPLISSLLMEMQ